MTIVITGSNFASNCVVRWNGNAVETAFNDAGRLIASVPGSLLVNAGVVPITVTNPSGLVASPMTFTVIPSTPRGERGQSVIGDRGARQDYVLTVQGAYFTPTSTVLWNNAALATTFASTAQVTAVVPANLVAAAGKREHYGIQPRPAGLESPHLRHCRRARARHGPCPPSRPAAW